MPIKTRQFQVISVCACLALGACAGQSVRPGPDPGEVADPAPPALQPHADTAAPDPGPAVGVQETGGPVTGQAADAGPEYTDLWERIRAGFAFPELENQYVDYYVRWYQDRPDYLQRMTERASRYLYYIVEQVEQRGMPMEIALLPAIESAFKPNAYSRAHAAGLWQFIPATGRRYGLKQNWWYDGRRDVIAATDAALNYLDFLHQEFNGDWFLALAAYNAGERRIQSAIRYNQKRGRPTTYTHLSLKSETRRYVPKLIAFKHIVLAPEKFGLQLPAIPVQPYFAQVATGGQIDLGTLARKSGVNVNELYQLNPAFRRWATDPDGPHRLLVPHAEQDTVASVIEQLPESARVRWANHRVRRGDTLGAISSRYRVSVAAIQRANRLTSTTIRTGDSLLIPVSAAPIATGVLSAGAGATAVAQRQLRGGGTPVVHHVRHGDTLWAIAKRYNVYVKQLTHWNELRASDVLRLGQKLLIYTN